MPKTTLITPDASTTVKGKIQLAGVLGGTAAAPTLAEAFVRGRRQNNTTDSVFTGYTIQMGWGFIVGDGTIKIEEAITFDDAFSSAPLIWVSYIGNRPSADGAPTGPEWFTATYSGTPVDVHSQSASTTGFTINFIADTGSTLLNTNNHGYTWFALGPV